VADPSVGRRVVTIAAILALAAAAAFAVSSVAERLGSGLPVAPSRSAASVEPRTDPTPSPTGDPDQAHADSLILFLGDGLGIAQREAGRLASADGVLTMDGLPYSGMVTTDAADGSVTDSAAAATAYSTGVKTLDGAIATDPQGKAVETLLERAEAAGKATGLVTTSSLTDASPAAFGAHVPDRDLQSEIARQFIEETRVDVLLGGGEDAWLPPGTEGDVPDHPAEDPAEGSRGDRGNLVERAKDLGYEYVSGADGLEAADGDRVLGLFANEEMFQQAAEGQGDRYAPRVSLEAMATAAIRILSADPDGFVLLVEEEAIDEMAHHNNARRVIDAVLTLDAAVEVGTEFAADRSDTLLVVLGDHETGGMTIERERNAVGAGVDGPFRVGADDGSFRVRWTTTDHTAAEVPVMSFGPGAERLTGTRENIHVHEVLVDALFSR
jgi:alkaline phosphatase